MKAELRESLGLLNCPYCGSLFVESPRLGRPWWECRNRDCQGFGIPSQIHQWPTALDRSPEPSE